jgi:hypothetical protein
MFGHICFHLKSNVTPFEDGSKYAETFREGIELEIQ